MFSKRESEAIAKLIYESDGFKPSFLKEVYSILRSNCPHQSGYGPINESFVFCNNCGIATTPVIIETNAAILKEEGRD